MPPTPSGHRPGGGAALATLMLALSLLTLSTSAGCGGTVYTLEDRGRYITPLATLNGPAHTIGIKVDEPFRYVETSSRAEGLKESLGGNHVMMQVALGEVFPMIGVDYGDGQGWVFFMDGDIHLVLDFFSESVDVLGVDFRVGGGFSGRGLPGLYHVDGLDKLTWRLRYLHESGHVGDSYAVGAALEKSAGNPAYGGFRVINVSYETVGLSVGWDEVVPGTGGALMVRPYAGYRWLTAPPWDRQTGGVEGDVDLPDASHRHEGQLGVEGTLAMGQPGGLTPSHLVAAAEGYLRRQYDYIRRIDDPRYVSLHLLAGPQWRSREGSHERRLSLMLQYYDGLNPRAQFRDEVTRFFGILGRVDH